MTTLAETISTALISAGYATVAGTDIVANQFTEAAAGQVCLIPMGGKEPDSVMGSYPVDYPGLQIQVRSAGPTGTAIAAAEAKAESIRTYLDDRVVGNYTIFTTRSAPQPLGADENGRYRFSVDFSITIERV